MQNRKLFIIIFVLMIYCGSLSCKGEKTLKLTPREITWNFPSGYELLYPEAFNADIMPTEHLVFRYMIKRDSGVAESALCIYDLNSDNFWWSLFNYPSFSINPCYKQFIVLSPMTPEPIEAQIRNVNFPEAIVKRIQKGYIQSSINSGIISVVQDYGEQKNDIYIYDLSLNKQHHLPFKAHGLEQIKVKATENRCIIIGYDPNEYSNSVQLWDLSKMEMLKDFKSSGIFPFLDVKLIGSDLFCFALEPGVRQIAKIKNGEILMAIGQPLREKEWLGLGHDRISIFEDKRYVDQTSCLLYKEQYKKMIKITAMNLNTLKPIRSFEIKTNKLQMLEVEKITGEWVILVGHGESSEECPKLLSMIITPYRLSDFHIGKPFEISNWGFTKPIVWRDSMISIATNFALVFDIPKDIFDRH